MTMLDELQEYLDMMSQEQIEKDWSKSAEFDKVGPTLQEFLDYHTSSMNQCQHAKQTIMNKFEELLSLCNGDVHLTVNAHKSSYETVEKYFETLFILDDELYSEIGDDIFAKMIEFDMIVDLTFYPIMSIGSYSIYHYDVELAIDMALDILKTR